MVENMGSNEKIRVIIADDHPAVRISLRRLLSRQDDIQVIGEAANGAEALQKVGELAPEVLLLDIEMPVMDGIEVARRLQGGKSAVRVLILSAYSDEEYIRMVMDQGVYGYLTKDEHPSEIANAVRQAASGKKIFRKSHSFQDYPLGLQGLSGGMG
jgi:DNA-binding NarL/FixJ family response regulator